MWKVQYKSHNAHQSWATLGAYGSEHAGLHNATRIAGKYFVVRLLDPRGNVAWSS